MIKVKSLDVILRNKIFNTFVLYSLLIPTEWQTFNTSLFLSSYTYIVILNICLHFKLWNNSIIVPKDVWKPLFSKHCERKVRFN
jgi:hypothetical protein